MPDLNTQREQIISTASVRKITVQRREDIPIMMKTAKMTVPIRIPKTLSIRYPPTKGSITLGHEYQA